MRDWTTWPTISTYLAWAQAQGCKVERPAASPDAPDDYRLAKIVSPHGGWVLEVFVEDDEPLMSTTVSRLDRRLGMKSRLFV